MLQLWHQERFSPRLHPRSIRHGRCPSLPAALRLDAFIERYELGYFEVAAAN